MTRLRQTLEVARWEVLRFFKWRDVLLSVAIVAAIGVATWAISAWQRSSREVVRVAVISELALSSTPELALEPHPASDEEELRAEVARGERDGLVILDDSAARLVVRKEPPWQGDLARAINSAMRTKRLGDLGVGVDRLEAALAPVPLALELTSGSPRGAAKIGALLLILLMLISLVTGTAYLFTSITGEKQQRVTEQLFTMASPQVLVDGKLLGVAAMALIAMLQMVAISLVSWWAFSSSSLVGILGALAGIGAGELAVLLAYTLAGTAFWLAATAALFATIDDPNSSARSSAMLLPMLPLSVAFIGLGSPDSTMMQVLSYVPITSMTVVPARLVLGDISPLSIALGLVLLIGSTWLVRRGVARIYGAAMLMYGKEPGLGEMLRLSRKVR